MKCLKCNKESTKRISPDLDIKGVAVCDDCADEVRRDMIIVSFEPKMNKWFNKKYKL